MNKRNNVFYRIRNKKKLFAFGDDIGEVPILGEPLSSHQERAILQHGILKDIRSVNEVTDHPYFLFDEDLYFTPDFVSEIVRLANRRKSSLRFCLADNHFNSRFVLPHSNHASENNKFNFYYVIENAEPQEVIVPQKTYPHEVILPQQIILGRKFHFEQCSTFITRLASPFHLLQANVAVNFMRVIKLRARYPQWLIDALAPVNSRHYFRALTTLNKRGKNCLIHPRAILENAILGDNVTIGANAIVRNSFIGSGTTIDDHVSIMNSVLGKNNFISNGNHISLSMTYDDVFLIHGPYQFSIFGRATSVFAVINCDIRLDQKTIVIPTDSGMLDSLQPFLGIAYGHHSKVGGGNIIAAGRIVPNHKIIHPPSNIILKFDS